MRKKKVAEHYNRISKYYDGFNFGFLKRLFEFRLYVEMLNYLDSGDAVLDVACGTGNMSFELATKFKRVYGIDISKGMLNRAKLKMETAEAENRQIGFIYGNGENLPFKDNFFDAVTCILAIEHFSDTERAISEMKRVLKDGGIMVFNLLEMRDGVLKKIFERRLQSLRRQFSTDLDSEKMLKILDNAEKYERSDILGPFFRFPFNNSVFVYQKQDNTKEVFV
ncbi:MAG: methyltransferase domain-containing protein [Methanophagales archaeon]|nr:methyltransferase domain-containing protein [Methanophagales archaeon]